jgi:putative hydrolase of the HAD superfamily
VRTRIACRAVFLDAGGVLVLPDRRLLAGALARAGIDIDPDAVPRAHYRAVRALDRAGDATPASPSYAAALLPQFGIVPGRAAEAHAVWDRLSARRRSGVILWSEPTPGAAATIAALQRAGVAVVIVTNSDGHAEENLAACGFAGVPVVDSNVVGSDKPDARIFHIALARAGTAPAQTVHVGDSVANDVVGARAAGITPIHLDPLRACRAPDHRHIRSLPGLWQHIDPTTWEETPSMS